MKFYTSLDQPNKYPINVTGVDVTLRGDKDSWQGNNGLLTGHQERLC